MSTGCWLSRVTRARSTSNSGCVPASKPACDLPQRGAGLLERRGRNGDQPLAEHGVVVRLRHLEQQLRPRRRQSELRRLVPGSRERDLRAVAAAGIQVLRKRQRRAPGVLAAERQISTGRPSIRRIRHHRRRRSRSPARFPRRAHRSRRSRVERERRTRRCRCRCCRTRLELRRERAVVARRRGQLRTQAALRANLIAFGSPHGRNGNRHRLAAWLGQRQAPDRASTDPAVWAAEPVAIASVSASEPAPRRRPG